MPQDLLHKLIYALIAGLTAFLPVSSEPHQMLYSIMTGFEHNDVFLSLSIHLGSLVALLISCKARIKRLSHERRLSRISRKRRNRQPDIAALLDVQVLKTAAIPLLLSLLLCLFFLFSLNVLIKLCYHLKNVPGSRCPNY